MEDLARGREAVVYALDSRRVLRRDMTDRPSTAGKQLRIVHLDFHPGNVILSDDGPRVIDRTNAHAAPRAVDVSLTDLILRTAPEAGAFPRDLLELGLSVFAETTGIDPTLGRATACAFRLRDPGLSADERARVEAFLL